MATELGKAYVQIMPSSKGISGSISKELSGESTAAGKSAGMNIVGAIKGAIVAAGIGKALKAAISEGGALEQSIGGIETLFKDDADKVRKYADEAYKTVGVSANDYMENVTSFSASLLQSMGGDTEKAAKVANMAMVDMGDNANKMGTSMGSIQDAYKGFAKQNYTMLDNLALGYGGTKTEMERLLADAQKLTGVEYDLDNLGDVYTAINAIQQEIGITGTTALEASETVQGSFSAMKSAFTNVLGALAIGEGLGEALSALAETVSTFLFGNFLPMIGNILKELPGALITFFQAAGPLFLENGMAFISNLVAGITEGLPGLLEKGKEIIANLVNGILEAIPSIIESAGNIITTFVGFIMENLPKIINTGKELLINLVKGIIDNLPEIIASAIKIVGDLVSTILEHLPSVIAAGVSLLVELAGGIISKLPDLIAAAVTLMAEFVAMLISKIPDVLNAGKDIVTGLWNGISEMKDWIIDKVKGFASDIAQGFKDFFGINSPATLMIGYGKNIDEGLGQGITENENIPLNAIISVADKMASAAKSAVKTVMDLLTIDASGITISGSGGRVAVSRGNSKAQSQMDKDLAKFKDEIYAVANANKADISTGYEMWKSNQRDKIYGRDESYSSKGVTQNITINSPKALSPSEIAKEAAKQSMKLVLPLLR